MSYAKFGQSSPKPAGDWVITSTAETVAGIHRHRPANEQFAAAVSLAEARGWGYGLFLLPEPHNPYDANALAIWGWCLTPRFLRQPRRSEWHLGYVERGLAAEMHAYQRDHAIPIDIHLRHIYKSGRYIDVSYFLLAPKGHSHSTRLRKK